MATVTVRPDSTPIGAGNFAIAGGAASINAALSDNNVATYVTKSSTGNGTVTVGFATTSIASGTRVTQVRLRAQILAPTSSSRLVLTPVTRVNGVDYVGSAISFSGSYALAEYAGAYFTTAPDGYAWDQDRIDGLRARIADNASGVNLSNVYELFFDIETTTQPTITVTAPASPVTNTSKPTVAWTYSDADGYDQDYYRIKVFPASQYTVGGFDPSADTPVWDSGVVASGDNTATIDYFLTAGTTYRAYVIAAKTVSGEAYYSTYQYVQFAVSTGAPAVPSLSASFNASGNRVWLSASGQSVATATRTNLVTNPSFEVNTTGWTLFGSTAARTTAQSKYGTACVEITSGTAINYAAAQAEITVSPSTTYSVGAWVKVVSLPGGRNRAGLQLLWYTAAGAYISETPITSVSVGDWTYYKRENATSPANAGKVMVRVFASTDSASNFTTSGTWFVDGFVLEQASTVGAYFDGSVSDTQPRGYSVAWTGTAHASTSVLTYTGFDSQVFQMQRSDDSGTSWSDVTGAGALVPSGAFLSTTYDYTAPRGETAQYRVRSVAALSGESIGSDWSSTQNVSVLNDGTWWLKAIDTPALNRGSVPVAPGFGVERVEQAGVFRPLGRGTAVVVTAGLQGEDGKLRIRTGTRADFEAIWALGCHVGTLLLQTPDGDQRYIRVTSRSYERDGTVNSPLTTIDLGYVEVSG